jgi:hypothetical protein
MSVPRLPRGYDAMMAGRRRFRSCATATVLGSFGLLGSGCAADRPEGPAAGSAQPAPGSQYLVIATAGNRRLNADLDPLEKRDQNDLLRAKADLRDAAATERLFDRRLLRIIFPSATERVARDLYRVNEARASLTSAAAALTSLRALHAYEPRLEAANRPVEDAVSTLRRELGLPPPPAS